MSKKSKSGQPYGHHFSFLSKEEVLTVGKRYVFFDSLQKSPLTFYNTKIYNIGSSLVSTAGSQLKQPVSEDKNKQGLNKIEQYINFIGEIAENEQGNEINFIKQMNNYLKKDPDLQKNFNFFLDNYEKNGSFDYLQLMNLINEIMKERDKLKEQRDKVYVDNATILSENFKNLKKELQQEALTLFEEGDFEKLNKFINKNLLTSLQVDDNTLMKYTTPINSLIANRINSTMINLGKSEAIRALIQEQVTTNGWDIEALYNHIYGMTVEYITKLDYDNLISKNGATLANEIIDNFNFLLAQTSDQIANNAEGLFAKKNKKTELLLEQVAFTTRKALADMFDNIEKSEQQAFLKQYLTIDEINLLNTYHKKMTPAKYRENFSKILGRAIREKFKNMGFKPSSSDRREIKEEVEKFMKKNTNSFMSYHFSNSFKEHFNIKTTGSSIAEYIATHTNLFLNAIVHGNSTKFKTDLSVTFSFKPFKEQDFLTDNSSNELDSLMNNFFSNFLEKYKKENLKKKNASEQTDVESAAISYIEEMKELQALIEKISNQDNLNEEQKKELLNNFSNFLLTSISVKDYNYYTDQLGFHGGSLGGGGTPENVLNNIDKMYQLGGISPIDKDLLLFALINCGPDGLAKGLKEDLATYLLGGAAMIMFDDGFTAANNFLNSIKKDFGFSISSLHLYRLQGKYVPASYIYSAIHENLQQVYGLLSAETDIANIKHKNRVIINNNITEQTHKPSYEAVPSAQARWDAVASSALAEVQITFVFMAGLLDIFEKIPQAFNNI